MKMEIVAIYDKAIEAYMRPFFCQSLGQAIRQFTDEVNRKDGSPMGDHPQDYTLFHIGTFHDGNANLNELEPHCLARAHEIVQKPENTQAGVSRIQNQAIAT